MESNNNTARRLKRERQRRSSTAIKRRQQWVDTNGDSTFDERRDVLVSDESGDDSTMQLDWDWEGYGKTLGVAQGDDYLTVANELSTFEYPEALELDLENVSPAKAAAANRRRKSSVKFATSPKPVLVLEEPEDIPEPIEEPLEEEFDDVVEEPQAFEDFEAEMPEQYESSSSEEEEVPEPVVIAKKQSKPKKKVSIAKQVIPKVALMPKVSAPVAVPKKKKSKKKEVAKPKKKKAAPVENESFMDRLQKRRSSQPEEDSSSEESEAEDMESVVEEESLAAKAKANSKGKNVLKSKAAATKSILRRTPPIAPRGVGTGGPRPRRPTLQMVQSAKDHHVLYGGDDSDDGDDGPRRSKRTRRTPLAYWRNERVVYSRSRDGLGSVLPVPIDSVVLSGDESDDLFGKQRAQVKSSKSKKSKSSSSSSKSNNYTPDLSRTSTATFEVYDAFTDSTGEQTLGITEGSVQMRDIMKGSPHQLLAGKFFDNQAFTNGLMQLGPGCEKPDEMVFIPEVFYVVSCPRAGLEVRIGDDVGVFGTGDSFHVPAGNKYSLRNRSKHESAKLVFFLTNASTPVEEQRVSPPAPKSKKRRVFGA